MMALTRMVMQLDSLDNAVNKLVSVWIGPVRDVKTGEIFMYASPARWSRALGAECTARRYAWLARFGGHSPGELEPFLALPGRFAIVLDFREWWTMEKAQERLLEVVRATFETRLNSMQVWRSRYFTKLPFRTDSITEDEHAELWNLLLNGLRRGSMFNECFINKRLPRGLKNLFRLFHCIDEIDVKGNTQAFLLNLRKQEALQPPLPPWSSLNVISYSHSPNTPLLPKEREKPVQNRKRKLKINDRTPLAFRERLNKAPLTFRARPNEPPPANHDSSASPHRYFGFSEDEDDPPPPSGSDSSDQNSNPYRSDSPPPSGTLKTPLPSTQETNPSTSFRSPPPKTPISTQSSASPTPPPSQAAYHNQSSAASLAPPPPEAANLDQWDASPAPSPGLAADLDQWDASPWPSPGLAAALEQCDTSPWPSPGLAADLDQWDPSSPAPPTLLGSTSSDQWDAALAGPPLLGSTSSTNQWDASLAGPGDCLPMDEGASVYTWSTASSGWMDSPLTRPLSLSIPELSSWNSSSSLYTELGKLAESDWLASALDAAEPPTVIDADSLACRDLGCSIFQGLDPSPPSIAGEDFDSSYIERIG